MFLITTANQKYWKTDEKVLFLGEWCKLYKDKEIWARMDHETLPFHWEDRARQIQGLGYINKLYERYLKILSIRLNELHQVDYGPRYWRIIIGPWLFYFLVFLYDRYLSIRTAIDSENVTNTWILQKQNLPSVPKDYTTFNHWSVSQDDYNFYIYSQIIATLGSLPYETKDGSLNLEQGLYDPHLKGTNLFIKGLLHKIVQKAPDRYKSIVFVSGYFHFFDLFRLKLSLRQTPDFFSSPPIVPTVSPDLSIRNKLQLAEGNDEFEKLTNTLIPLQIPTAYLESYKETHQKSLEYFPKNPKLILTATDLFGGEGFKFWTAHNVSRGCKLAGIQHGGGYGSRKIDSIVYNEIRACDRYYTWGWSLKGYTKTHPIAAGKLASLEEITPNPQGKVLVIGTGEPRYSRWDHGDQIGSEMDAYCQEQSQFFLSLLPKVQTAFLFRLHPAAHEWNPQARLQDLAPDLQIYQGGETMIEQLKQSRLCVCTNNSTTFLESIASNFPTLVYWNPQRCELRKNAIPYYESLKKVGIYHETPESAAEQANKIFDDPLKWWNSEAVQDAVKNFCNQFARTSPHWLRDWKRELLNLRDK